ncbi:T9SS C-terminal target domain-containing protein [Hymenobacter sediminis]|uniref:T9SS type A sorting domain-containing protein n=1 Tax=Hymenobacter sediminis TaxID=2218621 RepID=UPI000DA6B151|nr:T9SS type A sorting domain-containing protein [Hymenobacter sediminis]RPD49697.1 T9SS C-terminal target domain-containing protein [Hymenobacter sediminis]
MTLKFTDFLRQSLRIVGLTVSLGLAGLAASRAEGSKNLTPGTGTRGTATGVNNYIGYLQHNDRGSQDNSAQFLKKGSPATERMYVRMKPGETLYFGVRRIRSNDVDNGRLRLEVKYLDNNNVIQTGGTYFLNAQGASSQGGINLAPNQAGLINTPEEAAAGPRYEAGASGPTAGYNPLVYTPAATAPERDYWVEFMEVDANGSDAGIAQRKSWYDIWDFTVRDAAGEKPGRLYSQHWSFTAAGGNNSLSSSFALYPLIPNPNFGNNSFFVKRVSYAGIQPFGVILVANSAGTTAAGNFKAKRKSQTTNLGYAEYKLFVNNPDPAIYPTSPRPTNPTVTTSCANGITTFTLKVDQAGFGVVFIDGDQNGQYDRTKDRVLENNTAIGDNAFVWDGKTDSGAAMSQTNLSVTFSSGVGPVNFPIWDCEQAPTTGISVQDVRPGNQGAQDYIFWNDSLLAPNFTAPLINPIGTNTVATSHKWTANQGDGRLVNSYAVGLLARGNAIQITYDPTTACATTPPVVLQPLPVELVRFGAALRGQAVAVSWETALERNSAYFTVERSLNARSFEPIGRVAAAGNSTATRRYSFTDDEPAAGTAYYRLHQVDINGESAYSPVVPVLNTAPLSGVVYPNPVTSELNIRLRTPLSGPVSLRILDATGRVVWQQQRQLDTPTTLLQVAAAQLPAARWYVLQVQSTTDLLVQRFQK